MKYAILTGLMAVMFFTGCVTLQVKNDAAMNGLTEIIARRIAVNVAKTEPDKVEYLKEKCDEILAVGIDESAPLIQAAARYAVQRYTGDSVLYDDIMSMFNLFGFTPDVSEFNPDMVKREPLEMRSPCSARRLVRNE